MKVKYASHKSNDDGSNKVSFRLPDGYEKWYVTMPAGYPSSSVLEWIRNEGIADFLTDLYYKEDQHIGVYPLRNL